jgi:hypothetical protein
VPGHTPVPAPQQIQSSQTPVSGFSQQSHSGSMNFDQLNTYDNSWNREKRMSSVSPTTSSQTLQQHSSSKQNQSATSNGTANQSSNTLLNANLSLAQPKQNKLITNTAAANENGNKNALSANKTFNLHSLLKPQHQRMTQPYQQIILNHVTLSKEEEEQMEEQMEQAEKEKEKERQKRRQEREREKEKERERDNDSQYENNKKKNQQDYQRSQSKSFDSSSLKSLNIGECVLFFYLLQYTYIL